MHTLAVTLPESLSLLVAVISGVALAAACGFRVFVPLLVLSIASKAGLMTLGQSFAWMGETPALIAFSVASVLEVGAYYIPWLDHALDTIAAPASVIAGTLAVASQVSGMNPWMTWIVGIVAGGGAAGLVQGATMLTRGVSLITTGGIANPIVSTAENLLALLVAALAILIPLAALLFVGILLFIVLRKVHKSRQAKTMIARSTYAATA